MSVALVISSSHRILWLSLLLLPSIFSNVLIRWLKYWTFSFSIRLFNKYLGLISLRIYWFDLCCPRNFQESSPAPWFEGINSSVFRLLYGQLSQPYLAMALTVWTLVSRVMSLLFTTLFRFVIALLPRSKCLLISWLQSPSTVILEPKKRKSVTTSTFSPSICHEVMGLDAMILVFLIVLSF